MQAYSRQALAPMTAAAPDSPVSSRERGGAGGVVASDSAARPVDVVAAAQTLATLLLESLTERDLAVFARRLLPHLEEGQLDRAGGHSAYTVASLGAELGVSAKAVRCAITRQELRAVKRGSRWIMPAHAVSEWATAAEAHHATGRQRPAPLPAGSQGGRSLSPLSPVRREHSGTPRSSRRLAMSVEKVTRAGGEVVWRVRWRQHGRNRARTFSTRRDASDFDAEVRRQRRAGSLAALDAGAETLGEYVTGTWAASHAATLAAKTRLHYASLYDYHVRPYLGSIALREITPEVIGRWQAGESPGIWGGSHCDSACDGSPRLDPGARIRRRAPLGESCPAREEGEVASARGGTAACARNDRGNACSARRPRRDAHLHPRICGSSAW